MPTSRSRASNTASGGPKPSGGRSRPSCTSTERCSGSSRRTGSNRSTSRTSETGYDPGVAPLHVGDQLLHALVDRSERVLAQDRSLRLVVQLEVDPVHRVVAPALLGVSDELTSQLGPRRLRGLPHCLLDLLL